MGDYLEALGLKDEAMACWKRGMTGYEGTTIAGPASTRRCCNPHRWTSGEKAKLLLDEMLKHDGYWRFNFAMFKADSLLKAGDLDRFRRSR